VKIAFDKIGTTPKTFTLTHQGMTLSGEMQKKSMHRIELSGRFSGKIDLECDRCGNPYHQLLDDPFTLGITDEISQDKEDLDIIEFLDGVIDMTYIIESEINALIGDYHFCPVCTRDNTLLNREF